MPRALVTNDDGIDSPGLHALAAVAREAGLEVVVAALDGWFDPVPDIVLSGINHGANVGRAVLHSGTVGAALTAGISDTRALAVSLDVALHPGGERQWDAAAAVVPRVLDLLRGSPAGTVLPLDVPDVPAAGLGPLRHARQARGGAVQARVDDVRDGDLHLGEVEVADEPEEGSDSAVLAAGHPTLTALRSVTEAEGDLVQRWLFVRVGGGSRSPVEH